MVALQIGDRVKIIGGSTHVGKTGVLKSKTKVMASIELQDSGVNVKKKQKFLATIPAPTEDKHLTAKEDHPDNTIGLPLIEESENTPPVITNDILITVPSITATTMLTLLDVATKAIETVVGEGSVIGKGIVHRNMKELKFKLASPTKAVLLVAHFKAAGVTLSLHGQVCTVSLAEPGRVAPSFTNTTKNYVPNQKRPVWSRNSNQEALPSGRSLFDRLQDGTSTHHRDLKKQRRW